MNFRFVQVMTDLEHVEETEERLWYVLEKEDLLSWELTVGEICAEELNFIHRYSQKVNHLTGSILMTSDDPKMIAS